jgi:hypothetical protein
MAAFIEAQFTFQPHSYYALVVFNEAQSHLIVTWLPRPSLSSFSCTLYCLDKKSHQFELSRLCPEWCAV